MLREERPQAKPFLSSPYFVILHLYRTAPVCVVDHWGVIFSRSGHDLLLVDPVVLSRLPPLDLALLEPESNLLLGGLDGVRAVADVAADIL